MIPTIEEVMQCYQVIAQIERAKTGCPCERTVRNVIQGTRNVCDAAGIKLNNKIDALTRKSLDWALAAFMRRGITRLSAWSYVCQLRGLFARWCLPYYNDAGWVVPPLKMPIVKVTPPRYIRPSAEILRRVKNWYMLQRGEYWFAATMMLEFAMRNGDILRLKDVNFIETKGGNFLSYTPHKTELSSGRRVYWPIHNDIWQKFNEYGRLAGLDVTKETFERINRNLRVIGFCGSKASYELRKICIDHIYQNFGAEMAVSISGDDIRTISRYYADPARPNIGSKRILDFL